MSTKENRDKKFLQQAIDLAVENVKKGKGGPFGAIIVKNNKIIDKGTNVVTSKTTQVLMPKYRQYEQHVKIKTFHLKDCTIYSSRTLSDVFRSNLLGSFRTFSFCC